MEKVPLPPLATIPSRAVADSRLSKTDWRVLVSLCARRNKTTRLCNPSVARIADDISVDPRHVRRSRERLRKYGYINWTREGSGRRSTCRYEIFGLLPEDGAWGSRDETRPDTASIDEREDLMFGNLDELPSREGCDELGAECAPLHGAEFSPPNEETADKDDDWMFGNMDELAGGAGFNELGAECAPLYGGEFSPPNIEKEHRNENIPKEHSASPRGDAGGFGEKIRGDEAANKVRRQLAIFERRIRKFGVTEEDLKEMKDLYFQTLAGPREVFGHVLRVYEVAVEIAPEEIRPDWARVGE